jgi:outer membrane protein assembly factor BamD
MRKSLVLVLLLMLAACGKSVQVSDSALVERDRELYETAMQMLEKSRFDAARLQLNTLLATYQDSEFAPQAKYAFADSYYMQSGNTNLTSAELEFRDFMTFFPTHDLADDAQLKIAMTHVKQIQKPDRDNTHAKLAEFELTTMIDKFPDSPLSDEAKAKLREVQEVLAESIFGPARHYYRLRAYRAAVDRCEEIMKKYPDFTGMDRVLYMLGESHRQMDNVEGSVTHYARIVRDYPLSDSADDARDRLLELNAAVPNPNPIALERARQNQPEGKGLLGFLGFGLFGGGPQVSTDTNAASARGDGTELSIGGQPTP